MYTCWFNQWWLNWNQNLPMSQSMFKVPFGQFIQKRQGVCIKMLAFYVISKMQRWSHNELPYKMRIIMYECKTIAVKVSQSNVKIVMSP